ncbi:hypothetical protein Peur_010330 [Populus x canadensis]
MSTLVDESASGDLKLKAGMSACLLHFNMAVLECCGFRANISKSCSKTMCEEAMFSGATGRIDSTMITLPSLGRASQQFLRSFKQRSSLQATVPQ